MPIGFMRNIYDQFLFLLELVQIEGMQQMQNIVKIHCISSAKTLYVGYLS